MGPELPQRMNAPIPCRDFEVRSTAVHRGFVARREPCFSCTMSPASSRLIVRQSSSDSASRSLVAQVVRTHLGPTEIDLHHGVPFLHPDSTLSKTTVGRCTVSGSFGAQPPSMHPTNTFPPSNSNWPQYFSLRPRYPPHHWLFHENFACDS